MAKQGKILIIDDVSSHLQLLQRILSDEGYETEIMQDPRLALKELYKNNYQVVLLDIMMPSMDGFQVLEKIKNTKKIENILVIIISAKTDPRSIKNAVELGAFDYISKPINIQDVKNKVKAAMLESVLK